MRAWAHCRHTSEPHTFTPRPREASAGRSRRICDQRPHHTQAEPLAAAAAFCFAFVGCEPSSLDHFLRQMMCTFSGIICCLLLIRRLQCVVYFYSNLFPLYNPYSCVASRPDQPPVHAEQHTPKRPKPNGQRARAFFHGHGDCVRAKADDERGRPHLVRFRV